MNWRWCIFFVILLFSTPAIGQNTAVSDSDFDNKVNSLLSFSVPVISVDDLETLLEKEGVLLLDAREKTEFDVSHIQDAKHIGYNAVNFEILNDTPKDAPIVIYCSVGYRSEKVGEKLLKKGFKRVYNLYGSLFAWINQGNPVFDSKNKVTQKVHTYNRQWSKWIRNKMFEKVY